MPARPRRVATSPSFITPPRGERRVLGMLDQAAAKHADVVERAPHHQAVGERAVAVGEAHRPGLHPEPHLGGLLPAQFLVMAP